jgi:uncharacterized protein YgiM (DUF1202 family)
MAGRPRKSSFIKDIDEIAAPEITEKEEIKVDKEPEVEKAPEPSNNIATVTLKSSSDWLNVRSGPSTNDAIVGTLHDGDKITIFETKKNWGKISETEEKWVLLDFVI